MLKNIGLDYQERPQTAPVGPEKETPSEEALRI